jgi:hypothetical protein
MRRDQDLRLCLAIEALWVKERRRRVRRELMLQVL